jgi:Mlc titration factor MtfA (ptsG expression regulator)
VSLWDAIARRGKDLLRQAAAQLEFKLPEAPIPDAWRRVLERNVPLARGLSGPEKERLLQVARLLLHEVPFEGCCGLAIDDEIRVTIAATAALLVHKLAYPRFTKLVRVLVYPDIFVPVYARSLAESEPGEPKPHLGQAWKDGIVVLAWSEVQSDAANPAARGSVVLHEMAHILDAEDGVFDGTPLLDDPAQAPGWAEVLTQEFDHQRNAVETDQDAPLNDYAATNHAEFFAVATESFFCSPERLHTRLPELYEQLSRFYRQDPLAHTAQPSDDSRESRNASTDAGQP